MDFEFTSEQIMIREMVKEFVEKDVKPLAAKIDKTGVIEDSLISKARELGLFGICIPEKYGGANAGEMGYCITLEELSHGCGSFTSVIGGHLSLCATAIMVAGNEEQKNEYLPPMAKGEKIGAFALTEPQAGSDAANIALTAELKGDKWILNGTKIWVTNGARSDVVIVFALTDKALRARGGITAFIVEKDFGIKVGKVEEKLGLKASDSAELIFEDVAVPKKNVLGEVGKGFLTAMKTLDIGRLTLGAGCIGGSKELLSLCTEYSKTRIQFNEPIANKQAIQFYLANIAIQIYCMESIVYRTAWMADNQMKFTRESAIVKTFCTEAFNNIANMAMQIYGGYAYSKEYPVERFFRDARVMPIFEGTNEIQRVIIAQDILRKGF